ncbi:putative lipid II flippase FtsW [Pseudoruegeria sp. SK021]|uniref:putative lipid II flippase FtsW n=1 Tax=Pseudoruegeria sp. SK021 TaxID=1933035 RepID=UPI000A226A40|nr:putative lipid II flippase FtsW [Pseudoruegeria sp. SK021]OSP54992.1 putative lipid II flippase FtsW [Pseudoruegeria sp. SK021]
MTEMVHGALPVNRGEPVLPKWWRTIDRWTLVCAVGLLAVGLLLGLAASPPLAQRNGLDAFYYVQKQAIFAALGFMAMILCSMLSTLQVRRIGVMAFGVTFVALILLPVFGTNFGKGAIRWYSLGFGSLQPSEFLKPAYVLLAAWLMAASQEVNGPPGKFLSFCVALIVIGVLAMQPDFGQASLIVFSWGVMYFVAGAPLTLMVVVAALVAAGGFAAYNSSDHFARRIDGFLSTEIDPTTQIGYAANAIREGGVFGVGVGEGEVKVFLPDAHTDFIIAVAAEEYGLVLVLCIIALYATITVRSLLRLLRERDPFVRIAGTGLAAVLGMQAMINMGVAVRLLPTKGMTLPFVSYGGSSAIAAGITVGMLLALTRTRPQGRMADLLRRAAN